MNLYLRWIGIVLAIVGLIGTSSTMANDGTSFQYFIGQLTGNILLFLLGLLLYRKGKKQ